MRMSLTLTGKEIRDLAEFAGIPINQEQINEGDLEAEYTIHDCPKKGVIAEEDKTPRFYSHIATLCEYPEEGCMPLGDEIKSP